MPNGFVGPPAASFLPKIEEALRAAAVVHNTDPFENLSNWAVFPPPLPPRPNKDAPHPGNTAMIGSHFTGVGNVRNIVVGLDLYYSILQKINITDDKISEQMYHIAKEIESICSTSYILPQAVPRCLRVSKGVENNLIVFRALTDAAIMETRKFNGEIMSV